MNLLESQIALRDRFSFDEEEYKNFTNAYSQELLDFFMDTSIMGISLAFMFRVVFMNINKTVLDIVLPFCIFSFILIVYWLNKIMGSVVKRYFHAFFIPMVGILTARKSISQNENDFYLNPSFASWIVIVIYASFISPLEWHKIAVINNCSVLLYFTIVYKFYGSLDNDFIIHVTTASIFIARLVRMNELNQRTCFNLLHLSK